MAMSVNVSVEAAIENSIQEVTLDGKEIYVPPLSMSENLSRLAAKIDFTKESEDGIEPAEKKVKEAEEKKTFEQPAWPWESVRDQLRNAHTEMSVLLDVLNIAKGKHYMVLDPVVQDPPESKAPMHLLAKKKSLSMAASVLNNGSDRLRKLQTDIAQARRSQQDFHFELLNLRKAWRLRKVGDTILGDLSFRSAGSTYKQGGTFEVTRLDQSVDRFDPSSRVSNPLQVVLPSDLEVAAFIHVTIRTLPEKADLASVEIELPTMPTVSPEDHWDKRLEVAQNVIFCKEVFQTLAREAVQMKTAIPNLVIGNQILSHLFPGVQLSIALCHYPDKSKKGYGRNSGSEHDYVLEHSLHQLLRNVHRQNLNYPIPHPVSAMVGWTKERRLAGPHAYTRSHLVEMSNKEPLLSKIIKQAKHIVLRKRTIATIDELAETIPDPQIAAHCLNISGPTQTMIKVIITSHGYENPRTTVALHIEIEGIRAVSKDGRVFTLSYEAQEMKDFILCQIALHHITAVTSACKWTGWSLLTLNNHTGVGDMEQFRNANSALMVSSAGDRVLAVRSGPSSGLRVSVQKCPWQPEDNPSPELLQDDKWSQLGGKFQPIDLTKLPGRNFIQKLELLMAALDKEKDISTLSNT